MSIPNDFNPLGNQTIILEKGVSISEVVFLSSKSFNSLALAPYFEMEFDFKAVEVPSGYLTYILSYKDGVVVGNYDRGMYALQYNPTISGGILQFHNNTKATYWTDHNERERWGEYNHVKVNSLGMELNGVWCPGGDGVTAYNKSEMNQLKIQGPQMDKFVRLTGRLHGEDIFDYRAARREKKEGILELITREFIEI